MIFYIYLTSQYSDFNWNLWNKRQYFKSKWDINDSWSKNRNTIGQKYMTYSEKLWQYVSKFILWYFIIAIHVIGITSHNI